MFALLAFCLPVVHADPLHFESIRPPTEAPGLQGSAAEDDAFDTDLPVAVFDAVAGGTVVIADAPELDPAAAPPACADVLAADGGAPAAWTWIDVDPVATLTLVALPLAGDPTGAGDDPTSAAGGGGASPIKHQDDPERLSGGGATPIKHQDDPERVSGGGATPIKHEDDPERLGWPAGADVWTIPGPARLVFAVPEGLAPDALAAWLPDGTRTLGVDPTSAGGAAICSGL